MEVSEEQKRRIEANRAAALARRNAKVQCPGSVEPFSRCVRLPMQPRLTPLSDVIVPNWNDTATKACTDGRQQASVSRVVQVPVNKENDGLTHSVSGSHFCASRIGQHCGGFRLLYALEKPLLDGRGTGVAMVKVGVEICAPDRFSMMMKRLFWRMFHVDKTPDDLAKCKVMIFSLGKDRGRICLSTKKPWPTFGDIVGQVTTYLNER